MGLNCLPPVTSGPKRPFCGPELPPFCHFRPEKARSLGRNCLTPAPSGPECGGRVTETCRKMGRLRQNRPFLTEAGRFAGRLRHLWQSASDIRVRSASDIRAFISVIYGTSPTSVCSRPPTSVCSRPPTSVYGRLPTYVQLASVTRVGRLCHLQDISVNCGGLGLAARPSFHRSDGRRRTISFFDGNFSLFSLFEYVKSVYLRQGCE